MFNNKFHKCKLLYNNQWFNNLKSRLLNKFHKPIPKTKEPLLLNKQILKENQELNIFHMKQVMLITKQSKELKQFHTKKDLLITMQLNIKLNIFLTHILINMSIIFHKKKYIMNMLLKKDNNKELSIKLFKNKQYINHKSKLLIHKHQDHKMLWNQELSVIVMYIMFKIKFHKYNLFNQQLNMFLYNNLQYNQYNKYYNNKYYQCNNHKLYINNHRYINNQCNNFKLHINHRFQDQFNNKWFNHNK